jgi:DNA polymerase-3 subunit alpha
MMVYQEQVMQIASVMAGFSLGEADLLRRAMSKKKQSEMDAMEQKFVAGAVERRIDEATAREVFRQIAYFAGYGFNKSHSAAYAIVSYRTAYLKAHHPAEFMAASLTSEMDSTDRVMVLVEECRRLRVPVLGPCLNSSRASFRVTEEGIRFGLGAVKNVGVGAIQEMVAERERRGPFRSLHDFTRRVRHDMLNRRVLESLVAAGALDSLGEGRARSFAAVPAALEAGARHQHDEAMGQTSLFGLEEPAAAGDILPALVPEWDRSQRLRREKEVLGFYLSEHPLDHYRDEISAVASGDTQKLKTLPTGAEVGLLGVISGLTRKVDRKGRTMGFVQVEDHAGTLECVLFHEAYEKGREFLEEDRVVLVRGRLDRRDPEGDPKIVASEVKDFEACRAELEHTLYLKVPLPGLQTAKLGEISEVLGRYPGRGEVVLLLDSGTGRRVRMRVRKHRVGVHPDLLSELRSMLGEDAVRLGEAVNGRNGR